MTIAADSTGTLKKRGVLLSSSQTLDGVMRQIAAFYSTQRESVNLTRVEGDRAQRQLMVKVCGRDVDAVRVFPHRGRFQFATVDGRSD